VKVKSKELARKGRASSDRQAASKSQALVRFIAADPAFLAGAASVLDLGATMLRGRPGSGKSAIKRRHAIVGPRRSDLARVAGDFRVASGQTTRYTLRRAEHEGSAEEPVVDSEEDLVLHGNANS